MWKTNELWLSCLFSTKKNRPTTILSLYLVHISHLDVIIFVQCPLRTLVRYAPSKSAFLHVILDNVLGQLLHPTDEFFTVHSTSQYIFRCLLQITKVEDRVTAGMWIIFVFAGKNRSPAISQLVHLNATQSLIKHLGALQVKENVPNNDILIQEIVWTLSQLAQRGDAIKYCLNVASHSGISCNIRILIPSQMPLATAKCCEISHFSCAWWSKMPTSLTDAKFSLKTRLLGAVKTFHYFLKAYHNHAKLLLPILLIVKALSRNCKYRRYTFATVIPNLFTFSWLRMRCQ